MKSARFLVVALLLSAWHMAAFAAPAASHSPERVFRVAGYVLDAVSRKPVPQVLVQIDRHQVLADSTGHFAFTSIDRNELHTGCPVVVHTIYYDGHLKLRAGQGKANENLTILVHRNHYRFRPVATCPASDSVSIHPFASPQLFNWWPGIQVAILIKHKASAVADSLSAISFYGSNSSSSYPSGYGYSMDFNPFRLRIYRIDAGSLQPTADLLTDNVVLCFPKIGETHTFDLRQYKIVLPSGDFVVGLETLVQGDKFYGCPPMLEGYHPSGVVLRPPCASAESRTWEFDFVSNQWQAIPSTESCWPVYENMVSVEVEPAPAKR